MEQIQLLKAKLSNDTVNYRLGPQSKQLLKAFTEYPEVLEKPQEAFTSACIASKLMGPDSLVLASRLRCEHIIKGVFATMNLDADIDSITPILMAISKEEK